MEYRQKIGVSNEIVGLVENVVVCKLNILECRSEETMERTGEFKFIEYSFYRISAKGKFGKYQIQNLRCENGDVKNGNWVNYEQRKLNDCMKIKGYKL